MKKRIYKFISVMLILAVLLTSGTFAIDSNYDDSASSTDVAYEHHEQNSEQEREMFEDVSSEDWFHRYVTIGLRFGIVQGVNKNGILRFEPNRSVTRAEFITMLGRLHEYGNETIGTPDEGAFYERYLDWAVENELIHGNEHGDLMPEAFVTREQMVVIVVRYITTFGLWEYFRTELAVTATPFHGGISRWAWSYVEWYRVSIRISGGSVDFRPRDYATRYETIELLARVCSAVYDQRHPLWYRSN